MAVQAVYHQGWTLDEVNWSGFQPELVDPVMLAAVKAAALVEYNAPDYVVYLKRVFANAGAETLDAIERWGCEEGQHGKALSRWAQTADPDFKMDEAFARFRKGYTPAHFASGDAASVRGSRRGEMIARCVVESGTSSYYSAIRDATDEPLLKEIAGRIAADEYRHYKLFYDTLHKQDEPKLPFWRKLWIAVGRVTESGDDELAYAFYCANVKPEEEAAKPYNRKQYAHLSAAAGLRIYRRNHIRKLVQMVAKAIGANPHGWLARRADDLLWGAICFRLRHDKSVAA
jgi:hypothetical protein